MPRQCVHLSWVPNNMRSFLKIFFSSRSGKCWLWIPRQPCAGVVASILDLWRIMQWRGVKPGGGGYLHITIRGGLIFYVSVGPSSGRKMLCTWKRWIVLSLDETFPFENISDNESFGFSLESAWNLFLVSMAVRRNWTLELMQRRLNLMAVV